MRIVSNYLLGDPGLTGAFGLFCGTARYENVIAVIEDDHDIQTYENYYTAISSYFEGLWNKPIFVNESNFVESEDDLEVPVRLIYNSFVFFWILCILLLEKPCSLVHPLVTFFTPSNANAHQSYM